MLAALLSALWIPAMFIYGSATGGLNPADEDYVLVKYLTLIIGAAYTVGVIMHFPIDTKNMPVLRNVFLFMPAISAIVFYLIAFAYMWLENINS